MTRRYTINKEFFSSLNNCEASFYWAGFLAANGSISTTVGSSTSKRGIEKAYRIFVNVAVYDKETLERMRDALGSEAPVKEEIVNKNTSPYTRASILISCKDLVEDLVRFGIFSKSKSTYTMPDWLVDHPDIRHFIRGWVDGLGGFYQVEGKKTFRTRGTVEFLKQLNVIFSIHVKIHDLNRPIFTSEQGNYISYVNNHDVDSIAHWLYDNCQHYMPRKRQAALI